MPACLPLRETQYSHIRDATCSAVPRVPMKNHLHPRHPLVIVLKLDKPSCVVLCCRIVPLEIFTNHVHVQGTTETPFSWCASTNFSSPIKLIFWPQLNLPFPRARVSNDHLNRYTLSMDPCSAPQIRHSGAISEGSLSNSHRQPPPPPANKRKLPSIP